MPDQLQIRQLLEEALDSGLTPDQVCREYPELLLDVREQWERLRGVEAQIEALFACPGVKSDTDGKSSADSHAELPTIPGYHVEELLGHGGMGMVYKARQIKLNRPVAIKMMLAGLYAGPGERQRFMREAEAMASLTHPHIVQVHEVGDFGGLPYFTMELVDGMNLAQKLAGMPQPARQAATLVATLAEAVHAAHESGIIHRDLKPANILLTENDTPKITDFGLARRIEGGPNLTFSGARVGTPSYMAPEQAIGKPGTIGPAVDIYALGAILYETLTGRPPFRAETALETERQVIALEPAPPSRLNAKVPRDLETICLKCLHKSPPRRYTTAHALANDLHRFLGFQPIQARPAGLIERSAKWARRRPTTAAVLAISLVLAMVLVSGGLWLISERATNLRAVQQDTEEVVQSQRLADWVKSGDALKRARIRLGNGGPAELRRRLDQAERDQHLVAHLDAIRLQRAGRVSGTIGYGEEDYERAFEDAGLCRIDEDPRVVAERVRASNIRNALVAALDDWALCASRGTDVRRESWLLEIARIADPDRQGWRDQFRDPAARSSRQELTRLADSADVATTPVNLLMALGELLQKQRGGAIPFFRKVQEQHPNDFWANHQLGYALLEVDPADAVRFFQAALAIRPETPGLHNNMGAALNRIGRTEEGVFHFRQAVRLDPEKAFYRASLGLSLLNIGRDLEATEHLREGVKLQPEPATLSRLHGGLRRVLIRQGRLNELGIFWRKSLEANPTDHQAWDGYAELCLFMGQEDDYLWARRALLDRFGAADDPNMAERTGRACLLLPASDDDLRRATILIDHALADERSKKNGSYPYFLFAKGFSEYRAGRPERSISIMEGAASPVLGPAPRLVLAMCRHRLGQEDKARKAIASAVLSFDWKAEQANEATKWIYHVLRREAETMILPNLEDFLRGIHQPTTQEERLALLGICQFKGLYTTAARLYAEAFAADPKLPEDLDSGIRYNAARYASLAGSRLSEDEANLGKPDERIRWRQQAREWLRADLTSLAKESASHETASRDRTQRSLANWKVDPDLAGLRDPAALEKLTPSERQACRVFWSDVEAVLKRTKDPT